MIIPCCQDPTDKNVSKSLEMIEREEMKTGKEYALILNNGGKLEVVPKKSMELLKSMLPNLKVYDHIKVK